MGDANMADSLIDFPSVFTSEQLDYIEQSVVEASRKVFGDKLRNVLLYGSYARGDFHEWSDVDIMVLADIREGDEWRQLEYMLDKSLSDLSFHMNLLLSVFVAPYKRFERMKDVYPFYRNIDRDGVRLCSTLVV
jgi:predicted nucleotidyltransferase